MPSNIVSREETRPPAEMPSAAPQNSARSDEASLDTLEQNGALFGEINSREMKKYIATPEQELDENLLHSDWSPRPLLDPGASQFSRSLNDVSILTNRDQNRDQDSKV